MITPSNKSISILCVDSLSLLANSPTGILAISSPLSLNKMASNEPLNSFAVFITLAGRNGTEVFCSFFNSERGFFSRRHLSTSFGGRSSTSFPVGALAM